MKVALMREREGPKTWGLLDVALMRRFLLVPLGLLAFRLSSSWEETREETAYFAFRLSNSWEETREETASLPSDSRT